MHHPEDTLSALAYSPSRKLLVSGAYSLRPWPLTDGRAGAAYGHRDPVSWVGYNPMFHEVRRDDLETNSLRCPAHTPAKHAVSAFACIASFGIAAGWIVSPCRYAMQPKTATVVLVMSKLVHVGDPWVCCLVTGCEHGPCRQRLCVARAKWPAEVQFWQHTWRLPHQCSNIRQQPQAVDNG